jgi:glycerol-3-phosphate O-acyltransferase/dihydroxyacetone phosphate acyltransferase
MKEVTLHADNYEELQAIYLARRFYLSPDEE